MPTYKDIFNLNLKYIEYLLAKTSLTQEYIHNISVTGAEIEHEVRRLLRNLLPQRFHVTHRYIISAPSQEQEPAVSPQVDVIIVDTLVPPYFSVRMLMPLARCWFVPVPTALLYTVCLFFKSLLAVL